MAMKVEVTVADILRSFTKGVISERIAIRKLEKLLEFQYQLGYVKGVANEKYRISVGVEELARKHGDSGIIVRGDNVYET